MLTRTEITDRTKYIGGSDMPVILGVSQYKTPIDLFLEKTGKSTPETTAEQERFFRRGKRAEPYLLAILEEEKGIMPFPRSAGSDMYDPSGRCAEDA